MLTSASKLITLLLATALWTSTFTSLTYARSILISQPKTKPYLESIWKKIQKIPDQITPHPPVKKTLETSAKVPWTKLNWGDLILGRGTDKMNFIPYGYFRHAGIWHHTKKQFVSATPKNGVCFESPSIWERDYPRLEIMTVSSLNSIKKKELTYYAQQQIGKPYRLSSKATTTSWYCSKIPWACYKGYKIDLDAARTYLITPDSLYNSKYTTSIFSKKY